MTIKELKEKIATLPDDMKVGGIGYFGELLECSEAEVSEVYSDAFDFVSTETIFCISFEDAGEEPD